MKKMVAAICCILYLNSFSQAPGNAHINPQKIAGQKVLMKAIAVMVNTEANKKAPPKYIQLAVTGSE